MRRPLFCLDDAAGKLNLINVDDSFSFSLCFDKIFCDPSLSFILYHKVFDGDILGLGEDLFPNFVASIALADEVFVQLDTPKSFRHERCSLTLAIPDVFL